MLAVGRRRARMKLKLTIFMSMVAMIQALSENGLNVCGTTKMVSVKYKEHYTIKCGWWGWQRCKHNRVRTRYNIAIDYNCCDGWTSTDNFQCDVAWCFGQSRVCPNGGTCTYPNVCSCRPGFTPPKCDDTNECSIAKGGCSHTCVNTVGSYHCTCPPSFGLLADKRICAPICKALPPGECPNGGECIKPGECYCASGFNEPNCEDINECDTYKGGCSSKCINTVGSYHCSCEVGYGFLDDKKTCKAVCQGQKPGVCPNQGTCVTPETCECTTGFSQPACADINECSNSSGGCEQHCINTHGSYHCTCNYGYGLLPDQRSCRPMCFGLTPGTCANGGTCIKPTVCQCLTGYSLPSCADIDECKEDEGGCSDLCENSIGSYRCKCASGYRLMDDHHTCTDINECMSMNGGCAHICQNYPGYHSCSCLRGYNLADNGVTCQDFDECALPETECTFGCVNIPGSFTCSCSQGYRLLNDEVTCEDIDECAVINGGCGGSCVNSPGSFYCTCGAGYVPSQDNRTCVDLNECRDGTSGCSHYCINEQGTFRCDCPVGFTMSQDQHSCTDTNECAQNNGDCDQVCSNTDGSRQCSCDPGFVLSSNKETCHDQSSCPWSGAVDCWPMCTPAENGDCSCPEGHVLHSDGARCIDPCFSSPCQHGGVCSPAVAGYQCACADTGYGGTHCEVGVVGVPGTITIRSGELSDPIVINARPEREIIIHVIGSESLEITPNPIVIKFPSTESSFRLLAPQRGGYTIRFNISGSDSKSFKKVTPLVIHAGDVFTRLKLPNNVLPVGTFFTNVRFDKINFQFSSTSPWYRLNRNPNVVFTHGVTYTVSGNFSLPVSVSGLEVSVGDKLLMGPVSSLRKLADGSQISITIDRTARQPLLGLSLKDIKDFIHKRSIFKTLFEHLKPKFPPWLRLETVEENVLPSEYFEFNIFQGSRIQRVPSCQGAPLHDHVYYHVFRFTHAIIVSIMGQETILPDTERNAEYCLILDIKNDYGTTFIIMFPDKAAVILQELEMFRKLKESLDITVYPKGIGLSFTRKLNVHRRVRELTFWNGDELFQYPVDDTATFWAAINANKTVDVTKEFDFSVAASAETFLAVPDVTKIFTHLFVDPWNILIRLSSSFDVMFKVKIFKKVYPIYLKSLLKIDLHAYAAVGGQIERHYCGSDANPPGVFLAANVDTTLFRGIPIVQDILFTADITAYVFKSFDAMSAQDIVSPETVIKTLIQSVKAAASRLLDFLKLELKRLGQVLVSWALEKFVKLQDLLGLLMKTISDFGDKKPKLVISDLADITKDITGQIQTFDDTFKELKARLSLFVESALEEFMLKVDHEVFLLKQTALHLVKKLYADVAFLLQGSSTLGIRGRFSITVFGYFLALQGEFVDSDINVGLCGQFKEFYEHLNGQGAVRIFGLVETKLSMFHGGNSIGDKLWKLITIQVGGGLEVALARETNDFVIRLHGRLNFLGFVSTTDILITNKGIYSVTEDTLWNLFRVRITMGADIFVPVSEWALRVRGEFLPVGDSLDDGLGSALRKFSKNLADAIVKRLKSAQEGLKKARDKLSVAQNWLESKKKDVDKANVVFDRAIAKLETAKQRLEAAKGPYNRALETLSKAQKRLDGLCRIRSCGDICIPGINIRICTVKFFFFRIPYPCIRLTSCMLRVPDFICHGMNVVCKAVRWIAYAALEVVKIFVRIPMVALDVAKGALSVVQVVVDKSRVVLDVAKLIIDLAKLGLEAVKATLDAARIAIEVVKEAVKFAHYVFDLVIKYGLQSIFDVKACGFEVELSTQDLFEFEVFCDINPFRLGWRKVHFRVNFGNIVSSLWNIAKGLVDKFMDLITGSLGKRKRSVEYQMYSSLHKVFRNRRASNSEPTSGFNEAVSPNVTDDKIIKAAFGDTINEWIEHCREYKPLFEFLHVAIQSLENVSSEMTSELEDMKVNSSQYAMMLNSTGGLSVEDAEIDLDIAYADFNLSRDDVYQAIKDTNPDDDEVVQESKNAARFVLLQNDQAANMLSSFQIVSVWKSEMENAIKEYFNTSECSGYYDCVVWTFGQLYQLLDSVDPELVSTAKDKLPEMETRFYDLLNNDSRSVEEVMITSKDLMHLINAVDVDNLFCGTVPNFIEHPANETVKEGKAITVTCKAESIPDPRYYWYKDGLFTGITGNSLTLTDVTIGNTGTYVCVAGNHIANMSSTPANISVVFGARFKSHLPTSVKLISGKILSIKCDSVANPVADIKWHSTSAIQPPVGNNTLYMSATEVDASGLYLCLASNQYGDSSSNEMVVDIRQAEALCLAVNLELGYITKQTTSGTDTKSLSVEFLRMITTFLNELNNNKLIVTVANVNEVEAIVSVTFSVDCSNMEPCEESTCGDLYATMSQTLQSGISRIQNAIRTEPELFVTGNMEYYFNPASCEVDEVLRVCPPGYAEDIMYICTPSGPSFIMLPPRPLGTDREEDGMKLSWDQPAHSAPFLQGYTIEVTPHDGEGETVRTNLTADQPYLLLDDSFRETLYDVRVRGFTTSHNGDWLETTVDLAEDGSWRSVVGLCVGIGLLLIIAGVVIFIYIRRKKSKGRYKLSSPSTNAAQTDTTPESGHGVNTSVEDESPTKEHIEMKSKSSANDE